MHKAYKKTDYNIWRSIVHMTGGVNLIYIPKENNIKIGNILLPCDDNKVGEYLYKKFFLGCCTELTNDMNTSYSNSTANCEPIDATTLATSTDLNIPTYDYLTTTSDSYVYTGDYGVSDRTVSALDPNKEIKVYVTSNKENKKDMNIFKNFDFGEVRGDYVKLSMYGICVKNKTGTYVAYNTDDGTLMDVDILNFNGQKILYKMPCSLDQVATGDVVVHNNVPMFVIDVPKDRTSLDVIDPYAGERKEILPARSPFGFDFVTKVVNLFDQFTGSAKADAANPFGNMLPMLLLADNGDSKETLIPMMMLMGGNFDPMMAALMMSNGKDNDMLLPIMLMMNHKKDNDCKCGGQCQH